jgi:hypothetical protein
VSECAICEGFASFIKEEGGEYLCRECIKEGRDLE